MNPDLPLGAKRSNRHSAVQVLDLEGGTTSQWINAGGFRSCFAISETPSDATFEVEVLLPNGATAKVASSTYFSSHSYGAGKWVTMAAMCGLPLRFVADSEQTGNTFYVVLKS